MLITTHGYQAALQAIAAGNWDDTVPPVSDGEYGELSFDKPDAEALTRLLEWMVVLNHEVYRHSDKLMQLALDLRAQKVHTETRRALARHMQTAEELYLEGYARFRLYDYAQRLDAMMFRIVKNLNLSEAIQPKLS